MDHNKKKRGRWNTTPQGQAYQQQYRKEHYKTLTVLVPTAESEAYRAACKAMGIPYSRPLQDAISDVLSGAYKPL